MADINITASSASTSTGDAGGIWVAMLITASGASTSSGSASCVILTRRQGNVTQTGLQLDVGGRTTLRITQAGLQVDVSDRVTERVTQTGLQTEVLQRQPENVTQTGLGIDVVQRQPVNVTRTTIQIDARVRRRETSVNCLEFHIQNRSGQYLTYFDNAYDKSYMQQVNDVGAGQFTLPANDAKATSTNLRYGNKVLVRYRNIDVGTFIIEDVDTELVSSSEGGGELAVVSGRGLLATLERGMVYPSDINDVETCERSYSSQTRADIFLDLYQEFQGRGGGDLTPDFTATHDSDSVAWSDSNTLDFRAGDNLLEVMRHLAGFGTDFLATSDGTLQAWDTAGTDLSTSIVFRHGKDVLYCKERQSGKELTNVALGENQTQFTETTGATSISNYGRHERYVLAQNTSNAGQLGQANAAVLAGRRNPTDSLELQVSSEYHYPFVDYEVGDTIWVEIPDKVSGAYRILSISLEEIAGPCDLAITLEINSLHLEWVIRQIKAWEANKQTIKSGPGATVGVVSSDPRRAASATHSHTEYETLIFYVSGTLSAASHPERIHVPVAGTITNVTATVGTAPVGDDIVVDVNKDGTTIFTTQGNRPIIADGSQSDTSSVPDVTSIAQNDILTVDVDQVGSGTAGADLVVQVRYSVTI